MLLVLLNQAPSFLSSESYYMPHSVGLHAFTCSGGHGLYFCGFSPL